MLVGGIPSAYQEDSSRDTKVTTPLDALRHPFLRASSARGQWSNEVTCTLGMTAAWMTRDKMEHTCAGEGASSPRSECCPCGEKILYLKRPPSREGGPLSAIT